MVSLRIKILWVWRKLRTIGNSWDALLLSWISQYSENHFLVSYEKDEEAQTRDEEVNFGHKQKK